MTKSSPQLTEAGEKYAEAYAAHYTSKDLRGALGLYQSVMTTYPDAPEAEYCRAQINNIISKVVPKQELLEAQVKIALARLEVEP